VAVTTDLFLEDVHFLRSRDRAPSCGHRIATRAFSDLAAMGAEPICLFLSCGFPADLPTVWTRALYRGLQQACDAAGACIAGGDVAGSPHGILVDVIGLGRVRRGRALRRSGARPGDHLFVSGVPGMGSRGRELVHGGIRARTREDRAAVARHRYPRARWELGITLSRFGLASAAIDISDGISTDLDHLCEESGVGAVLDAERIPMLARPDGLKRALEGGEDYELLFTVPKQKIARFRRLTVPGVGYTEIGEIVSRPGMWLRTAKGDEQRLRPRGWEHFRKR
jgi:thiamine-monophosphate kinase